MPSLPARLAAVVLACAPAPALAGLLVRTEVQVDGAAPAVLLRAFGEETEAGPPTLSAFFDEAGNRCEAIVNADAVQSQTFVAVKVRCLDSRGRTVLHSEPSLLVKNGELAKIEIGAGTHTIELRVMATEDGEAAPANSIRRDFFVQAGAGTYRFWRLGRPWADLTCEPGDFEVNTSGTDVVYVQVEGRFRPGDVLETDCTAHEATGDVSVPVVVSFF